MIVREGLRDIAEDFKVSLADGVVGTDSTSADSGDTSLGNNVETVTLFDTVRSNKTVNSTTRLTTTDANGYDLYEQGLKNSDGTLLTRTTFPKLEKTSNNELNIFDRFIFERGT